jgi:hypothetical protein
MFISILLASEVTPTAIVTTEEPLPFLRVAAAVLLVLLPQAMIFTFVSTKFTITTAISVILWM